MLAEAQPELNKCCDDVLLKIVGPIARNLVISADASDTVREEWRTTLFGLGQTSSQRYA